MAAEVGDLLPPARRSKRDCTAPAWLWEGESWTSQVKQECSCSSPCCSFEPMGILVSKEYGESKLWWNCVSTKHYRALNRGQREGLKSETSLMLFFSISHPASAEDVEKMSKKMEEVKEAKVRVVSEEFLQDVKSSSKDFQELVSLHALSPWGAEVKMEHEEMAVDGKCSKPPSTKSAGKVKEEQGEEQSGCFSTLFSQWCACTKQTWV